MLHKIGLGGFLSFDTGTAEAAMGRVNRLYDRIFGSTKQVAAATNVMAGSYRDASGRLRDANGKFISTANALRATNGATVDANGKLRDANGRFQTAGNSAQSAATKVGMLTKSIMGMRGTGGVLSQLTMQLTGVGRSVAKAMGAGSGALGNLGAQLAMTGAALMPLTLGVKKAVTEYNAFNKQMSAVQAVGLMNEEQFTAMRNLAIELGSATKFTATEAAAGMEELTRAGYSVAEAMGAARPLLDLAAADNMELAEAAMWSANIIRGFGLSAEKDSGRVADVLALTSAKSNASVTSLGEAFKMSVSTSALLNISLEETAAILGKLHDSGLKGTMAGTSFSNMMNKLTKPTSKAKDFMEQFNIKLTDSNGKFRKVFDITNDVMKALNSIPDEAERVAAGFELTGLRGIKALNALAQAGKGGSTSVAELEAELRNAEGTAKRMAEIQLDNMAGQITILQSAVEGFTIRLFDMFKGMDGSAIKPIVDAMSSLNAAWDDVSQAITSKDIDKAVRTHGSTVVNIVLGIADGVNVLIAGLKAVRDWFANLGRSAEQALGPNAIRVLTKIGVVLVGIAAIGGPVLLFLGSLAFIIGNVIMPLFSSLAAVASAAFWPIVIGAGLAIVAFAALRKEGETLSEFATRMWTTIKDAAINAWENGIKPFWEGVKLGWQQVFPVLQVVVTEVFDAIKNLVTTLMSLWVDLGGSIGQGETDWKSFGETATVWLGKIISGILRVGTFVVETVDTLVRILGPVIVAIKDIIMSVWTNAIKPLWDGIKQGWTEVWPTLKLVAMEVFGAIMDLIHTVMGVWGEMTGDVRGGTVDWMEFGRVAVQVLAWIIIAGMKLVKWTIQLIRIVIEVVTAAVELIVGYFKAVWNFMKRSIMVVTQFFHGLIDAFMLLASGDVLGALKTAGLALLNFLLSPLRLIIGAIADLVDSLINMRAVKKLLPESTLAGMQEFVGGMREFADKGITLKDVEPAFGGAPKFLTGDSKPVAGNFGETEGEFTDMGVAGIAGFGSSAMAKLEAEQLAFDEHQKQQDAKDMASMVADAVAEGEEAKGACETNVTTSVNLDGKEVARNQAKHQQDLADRLGAKTPPYVRRVSAEQGTIPPR